MELKINCLFSRVIVICHIGCYNFNKFLSQLVAHVSVKRDSQTAMC